MKTGLSTRNYRLYVAYTVSCNTPLYWPYMYHYVTNTLGLSATEFGLLKGIYYATVVACEIPFGVIADRVSRKSTLAAGALMGATGCGLYTAGDGFGTLALAELVFGIATALVSGAGSALLYDSFHHEGRSTDYARYEGRAKAAALLAMSISLPATDLWLIRGEDALLAYAVTGGIMAMGVLAAAAMREPPRERGSALEISRGALREVRNSAGIRQLLLYSAGVFVLVRAANGLVFNPVMEAARVPVHFWGTTMAAIGLVGAWSAWRAHDALDRFGATAVRNALPVLSAAMYIALAFHSSPAVALIFCLNGITIGALPVVVLTGLNRLVISSAQRATILSIESLVSRASYGLAGLALSALLDCGALSTVLIATAAIGLLPLAMASVLAHRRPPSSG